MTVTRREGAVCAGCAGVAMAEDHGWGVDLGRDEPHCPLCVLALGASDDPDERATYRALPRADKPRHDASG